MDDGAAKKLMRDTAKDPCRERSHNQRRSFIVSKNEMTAKVYVLMHVLVIILTTVCFLLKLFIPVRGWNFQTSRMLLFACFVFSFGLTMIVTVKRYREWQALILPSILAAAMYMCISMVSYGNTKQIFIVAGCLIAIITYGLLPLLQKKRDALDRYAGIVLMTLGAVILFMAVRFMHINVVIPDDSAKATTISAEWSVEDTMEMNAEELCKLYYFEDLSETEKVELAERIIRIHVNNLGIPYELMLNVGELPEECYGKYTHDEKTITISQKLLESETDGWDLYEVLAHECYYSYSLSLTELYKSLPKQYRRMDPFQDVDRYYSNLQADDPSAAEKYKQKINEKADQYEIESVARAKEIILEYLSFQEEMTEEMTWKAKTERFV